MKRSAFNVAAAIFFLISCFSADVRAGDQPIVTSDLLRIRTIGDIDVAMDGTTAVFALRSIAEVEPAGVDDEGRYTPPKYENQSHLYVIDLIARESSAVQLTFGRRQDSSPRIAPDGSKVAFVRDATDDQGAARSQVWVLSLTGGEARQVTDFEHGATLTDWSPDARRLLVSSAIPMDEIPGVPPWPMERPGRQWKDATDGTRNGAASPGPDGTRQEIRAWLSQNAERDNPAVITRLDFQDELHLREPYRFTQLFVVDLPPEDPAAPRFNEKPVSAEAARQVTRDCFDHADARFMPDGRRIVYAAKKQNGRHIDRVLGTDLWIVNDDGSNDRLLCSIDGWSIGSPRPSLDGSVVAFIGYQLDEPAFRQTQIGLAPVGAEPGQQPVWLTDMLDRSVEMYEWMGARDSIYFNVAAEGAFPLLTISPGLIEPAVVVDGPVGVHEFDVGGGAIVYAETSAANPSVLKASTPRAGERVLFDPNPWIEAKRLSMPEEGWIDRPDGVRVQYWIMEPTGLEDGQTYPLVLEIHGGPSAMWGPGEQTMWLEFQLLCSWGYGVVYSNPRGSGGYGYEFQKRNFQNWGAGPAGDVLAVVDRAVQKPWVDRDRLVITGGSYAGYLTAWIIGHDQRFRAAVAQRGVYDLETFFGEGNAWRLVEWAMGGYPWESNIQPILQRESPFTYVRHIQTPLLIMHASSDLRTGVSQSEMLYRALKVLERPVEYVRYPDAGHDLSRTGDPHQRMDRLNRIIEFFERYIENPREAPLRHARTSAPQESAEARPEERSDEGRVPFP